MLTTITDKEIEQWIKTTDDKWWSVVALAMGEKLAEFLPRLLKAYKEQKEEIIRYEVDAHSTCRALFEKFKSKEFFQKDKEIEKLRKALEFCQRDIICGGGEASYRSLEKWFHETFAVARNALK